MAAVVGVVLTSLVLLASPASAECTDLGGVTVGGCESTSPDGGQEPEPAPSTTTTTTAPAPQAGPDRAGAARLLELVNHERAKAGLPGVRTRGAIEEIAWGHSHAMAEAGSIWHNDAYFTSENRRRLGASALGENVAMNTTVEGAHQRLMASSGHRANILDKRFNQVGIAVVRDARGAIYVTQDFAAVAGGGSAGSGSGSTGAAAPAPAPPPPSPKAAPTSAPRPTHAPPAQSAPSAPGAATPPATELSAGEDGGTSAPDGVKTATAVQARRSAAPEALQLAAAAAPGSDDRTGPMAIAAGICALCAIGLAALRARGLMAGGLARA